MEITVIFWNKEKCIKEAKQYQRRIDFKNNSKAYSSSIRLGILDEVCQHMEFVQESWSYSKCLKEAKKYKTRNSFSQDNSKDYSYAIRENIIDEVCSHMKKIRHTRTNKDLINTAKKCTNKKELYTKYSQEYRIIIKRGLLEEATRHMNLKRQTWSKDKVKKIASQYQTRFEFSNKDPNAYAYAKRQKILDNVCCNMESKYINWTPSLIQKEANKFTKRHEFEKKSNAAYSAATRRCIIDKVCSHMIFSFTLKEKLFQKKLNNEIKKLLNSKNIMYTLQEEVNIPKKKNKRGRVDLLLTLPEYGLIIPIELKHGQNKWSNKSIKEQIEKYNVAYSHVKGFNGTYLVSPKGKYGFSRKEFMKILNTIFDKEELYLPESLKNLKIKDNLSIFQ
jgi:hypothetical protein